MALTKLQLDRSLVFFDLETTGIDPARDRIVEISVMRLSPDASRESRTRRINPERPIPAAATAVHGIGDDDVRDAPTFRQVARSLLDWIGDSDLAGFNVTRFDLPLLERELHDCGLDLRSAERRIVDVMTIYHRKERRDLSAAVRFYLGRDLTNAHSAKADVEATADVLEAQLSHYDDLPCSVAELDAWARDPGGRGVDRSAKFVWRGGDVVVSFGKHQGKTLRRLVDEAPDYMQWILQSDFPEDAKEIVSAALEGRFPSSAPAAEQVHGPGKDQST